MRKSLELLKRIRQETCPATICPDFDKEECCISIEKELRAITFILENTIIELGFDEEEDAHYVEINGGKIICTEEEYELWKGIIEEWENS